MIFAGSQKDLERLDVLCVECWVAVTRVGNAIGMTRVLSAGRVHAWPGDPDDVASLLTERGFACHLASHFEQRPPLDASRETVVIVTGRLG